MVSIALDLIKYIPDLVGLLDKGKGKKAQAIADTISNVAEAVTGKKGDSATEAIHSDPALALKFKEAVMADSHVQAELELSNTNAARDMYKVNPAQASKVADNIMKYNLVIVFLLVIINILAIWKLKDDATVLALISNFIGLVLGSLLNERQAVVNFFFGSSMGSKNKGK